MDQQQPELKHHLHEHLRTHRAALLWKLDGLSERDARMPRTPTGTNLLGLVKHVACCEAGYFGVAFGRPAPVTLPWEAAGVDVADEVDMFATEDETMAEVLAFAQTCFDHADATIDALPIDAPGVVPWWSPDRRSVTLGQVLVHMVTEEARHAGHADILRELLDGSVGRRRFDPSTSGGDEAHRAAHFARLQRIAESRPV